jgi:hypothetical protein
MMKQFRRDFMPDNRGGAKVAVALDEGESHSK